MVTRSRSGRGALAGALSAVSALSVAVAAAGCSHPVTIGRHGTVQVALLEYRVRPDDIVARAGTITFVARNDGRLSHNLSIASGPTVLGSTPPIAPGGTQTLTLTLSAGQYTLSSQIQSDDPLGEHGTLTVTRR
jgi:hypothetical protein